MTATGSSLTSQATAPATASPDPRLVQQLVLDHLSIADAIARRYRASGQNAEDLRQVARLGLLLAAQRYRDGWGHGFLQFAVPTIRGTVQQYLRDHCWTVRPPRSAQQLRRSVLRAQDELRGELNREPTPAEVQARCGITLSEWSTAVLASGAIAPAELDPLGAGLDGELLGVDGTAESDYTAVEQREALRVALQYASPQDLQLLRLRFVEHLTQTEIAERLGVSQMQVSRLLTRLLATLRERMDGGIA